MKMPRSALALVVATALFLALQPCHARKLHSSLDKRNVAEPETDKRQLGNLPAWKLAAARSMLAAAKTQDYDYDYEKETSTKSSKAVEARDYDYAEDDALNEKKTTAKSNDVVEKKAASSKKASSDDYDDYDYAGEEEEPPTKKKTAPAADDKDSKDYDYDYDGADYQQDDAANEEASREKKAAKSVAAEEQTSDDYDYEDAYNQEEANEHEASSKGESTAGATTSNDEVDSKDATNDEDYDYDYEEEPEEREDKAAAAAEAKLEAEAEAAAELEEVADPNDPEDDDREAQLHDQVDTAVNKEVEQGMKVEDALAWKSESDDSGSTPQDAVTEDAAAEIEKEHAPADHSKAAEVASSSQTDGQGISSDLENMNVVSEEQDTGASAVTLGSSITSIVIVGAIAVVAMGAYYHVRTSSTRKRTGLHVGGNQPRYVPVPVGGQAQGQTSDGFGGVHKEWGTDDSAWEDVETTKAGKW